MAVPKINDVKLVPISTLNVGGGETTFLSGKNKIVGVIYESSFKTQPPAIMDTWSYQYLYSGIYPLGIDASSWNATITTKDAVMLWQRNAKYNLQGLGINTYLMDSICLQEIENITLWSMAGTIIDNAYLIVVCFD